ncbi:hypothetical protein MRV_0014 [Murid herpesvirus 3]|uniref:Uncharacterized protein n=2 Tax=Murid betaherpesvirus 3 TaxID=2560603 RepID=A0A1P8VIR2_9BETA|nr:hypothetical protein MRV_0014 [Murine roseolovirus]APZ76225.1 hypothetical protein MRV_0014 [Murid betaherpesvirus 3]AYH64793.1 hypothetical protein MRV_0014 [Murid herpesvirus 3]
MIIIFILILLIHNTICETNKIDIDNCQKTNCHENCSISIYFYPRSFKHYVEKYPMQVNIYKINDKDETLLLSTELSEDDLVEKKFTLDNILFEMHAIFRDAIHSKFDLQRYIRFSIFFSFEKIIAGDYKVNIAWMTTKFTIKECISIPEPENLSSVIKSQSIIYLSNYYLIIISILYNLIVKLCINY